MVRTLRHPAARKASLVARVFKRLSTLALGALALIAVTGSVGDGEIPATAALSQPDMQATLTYSGSDVIITGSIDYMFAGNTFSGPNRDAKGPRQLPTYNVMDIAKSFENARMEIAALRAGPDKKEQAKARIQVAAIDPNLMSAALDAIDRYYNSADPAPVMASEQLAYARENAPVTKFETPVSRSASSKELNCLATAIYFEARGEQYRGQVAVAQVVLNRVKHSLYPNTICGVVYQNQSRRNACQFSFACDGIPERVNEQEPWDQAMDIAKKITAGSLYLTEVANATHYHATYVRPDWARRMNKVTKIGLHVFYRFKQGWTAG